MFGSKGGKASKGRPAVLCPPALCQQGLSVGWGNAGSQATAVKVMKNVGGGWQKTVLMKKRPLLMMAGWHVVDWKAEGLVLGGGLCEASFPQGLLVSASRWHVTREPLVANQDSILMTSLYSLCFLSPCPTHAFFYIFFMRFFLAGVETQEAFGPR